jgi:hypothetical protein
VHVYYQYPVYVPDRDAMVQRSMRIGLDVEYHHMDVCSELPLFGDARVENPGAERTKEAVQIPVHSALSEPELHVVADRARRALAGLTPKAVAETQAVGR